jgi:hypothetical protein
MNVIYWIIKDAVTKISEPGLKKEPIYMSTNEKTQLRSKFDKGVK